MAVPDLSLKYNHEFAKRYRIALNKEALQYHEALKLDPNAPIPESTLIDKDASLSFEKCTFFSLNHISNFTS